MGEDLLPRFAAIPGGRFTMGSLDGGDDERPARSVQVDAFHASAHPVTIGQYAAFVRETGHPAPGVRDLPLMVTSQHELSFRELAAPYVWPSGEPPRDRGRHPVTLVTYTDAMAYCRWLSAQIGQLVRLPTEAEWERAARGGLEQMRYPWGHAIDGTRANFLPEPAEKRHRGTSPVGSYPPNGFELFDMAGNVWEWVADWYGADAYANGDDRNPRGPAHGVFRLLRGGSWVTSDTAQLRCAHRQRVPPDTYAYSVGFRVVYSG